MNSSFLWYNPTRVFVSKNNTWYVASSYNTLIRSGISGSVIPTTIGPGGYGLFVTDNGDIYTYDGTKTEVTMRSGNTASSDPVMFISESCLSLFVNTNNTLYCSASDMHQVVTKSLNNPTNTLVTVAGTGCAGTAADMLYYPAGIFVTLAFTLYVADNDNHRVQHFLHGSRNATTIAGNGAPGTISLHYPLAVSLDGNGYVFIVEYNNHRIIGSGPNGFRCVAGCTNTSGLASHQLSYPQGMSFDSDGNIWVADTMNGRIQKFLLQSNSCGKYLVLWQKPSLIETHALHNYDCSSLLNRLHNISKCRYNKRKRNVSWLHSPNNL